MAGILENKMIALDENKNLCETGYEMDDEPLLAALLTTGNGYMGIRGSFENFGALRVQGAFIRGYIDEITEVCEPFANNEYMKKYYLDEDKLKDFEKQDSCVNIPDPLTFRITVGEKTFAPWDYTILEWKRWIDSSTGVYTHETEADDGEGHITRFVFERFASFVDTHLYCQRVTVIPKNHDLPVKIVSATDERVKTGGQVITEETAREYYGNTSFCVFRAKNKYKFRVGIVAKHNLPAGETAITNENGLIGYEVKCVPAKKYVAEKISFLGTDRDTKEEFIGWLKTESEKSFKPYDICKEEHLAKYKAYFAPMDVKIEGDDEADGFLRYASYQTAISACTTDSVHGISAKGLTGERYNQFVWWDCEIHQLPFFIYTAPETAKNLLLYRYNMLEASKENARLCGKKGAKYAFCSSVEGDERVWIYARHPFMQIHINSDIPFGFFMYYDATGDRDFFAKYGIPVITECLRFWADRVTLRGNRYEILCVTGTDEHHPYVDNDAYTNYCVQYIFRRFNGIVDEFGVSISDEEKAMFKEIEEKLYLPEEENGFIPQFDGYFDLSRGLKEAGRGSLGQFQMKKSGLYNKSQVIKQPDVALLYTFADVGLNKKHYAKNWDYYEQMCETSSSLTFPVHAVASAENGRMLSFYNYFMKALKIDADDIHGVGWQGVHSGCLAGGYLSVLKGIFGVRANENGLSISPNPYDFWEAVTLKMFYRGALFELKIQKNQLSVRNGGKPTEIFIFGKKVKIGENQTITEVIK